MTVLSEEQLLLKDMASAWVRERSSSSGIRAVRTTFADTGYDPALYAEMAELGWTGIIVPQMYEGAQFGMTSLGLVLEELGRTLTASPLISTAVTVASALVLGGTEKQKSEWLPGIVSGGVVAAAAIDEGAHHAPVQTSLRATLSDDRWLLDGVKRPVLEAGPANLFLVVARTAGEAGDEEGISLFLVEGDAPGLTRTPLRNIDSRGAAIVHFDQVPVSRDALLGKVGEGMPLLQQVLDRTCAALAAEMLGSAVQAFETTVDYLRTRVQFDKPIGSFQALQHRAADMLGLIELTRSAVDAALRALDAGDPAASELSSLAKAMAGQTLRHVAREMVQMHGGIGMTDEHDAGLYLKRAQAADMAFGNAAFHRDRYGVLAGY